MSDEPTDPRERRREQQRKASANYRAARKAKGLPPNSGPSGPSGGRMTNAERQRRWRERRKKEREAEE